MEGLIPLLLHAIKKQSLHHHSHGVRRCVSDGSMQGIRYHLLSPRQDSFEGSSHRRTLSEMYQPPTSVVPFHQQQPDRDFAEGSGFRVAAAAGSPVMGYDSRKRLNGGYDHQHGQSNKEGKRFH
ncbi:hypothetical protein Dimus_026378 [Dionaea muscipula]